MKVGDTLRQTLDISGQRIELLCKVLEVEKNERISLEYSWDQLCLDVSFVFEPLDDSMKLSARDGGRMGGFLALFEPLVNGATLNSRPASTTLRATWNPELPASKHTATKTRIRMGVIYRHAWTWAAGATVSGHT
jgi:hypothetical protein